MGDIAGLPYDTAEFDKDARLLHRPAVPAGTTDLIVVSHGWNNDREAAESLYRKLFGNFAEVTRGDAAIGARKLAIVGVIWPSKKFDELMTLTAADARAAGGAASAGGGATASPAEQVAAMQAAIDRMAPLFDAAGDDAQLKALRDLAPQLEASTAARAKFVETLRRLLDPDGSVAKQQTREDRGDVFFRAQPDIVFDNASRTPVEKTAAPAGIGGVGGGSSAAAGSGHAQGLGSALSGIGRAVDNLLNLTTYFEMKKRAGTVGAKGLAPLVDELAQQVERVHLVGHSFGGRLVAAAAANSATPKLHTLALLQAAFSHNGFSKLRNGFFESVAEKRRIAGPIFVTHTKNDTAVGVAYPIASRVGRDNANALGDKDDQFGAIGSNGAQQMQPGEVSASAARLLPVGSAYDFRPGHFHNLDATAFIVDPKGGDAHGFVFVPEVAWALSRAIVAAPAAR